MTITPTDVKINRSKLTKGVSYIIGLKYTTQPPSSQVAAVQRACDGLWHFEDDDNVGARLVPNSTVNLPIHDPAVRSAEPLSRAGQTEPVKQQVVLNLSKVGMDSGVVLAQFDAKRQALALMNHAKSASRTAALPRPVSRSS